MKKTLLLKTMLLLCALIVGSTSAWADKTGTINFGSAAGSTNVNAESITGNDSQGNTWTVTTVGTTSFTPNAAYAQIGSGNKPASSITFTTTLEDDVNITAFSAKFGGFNSTAGTVTLKVDDTSVGTGSLNAANDVTVSNTSSATGKVLTVTVTGIAKGVKAYYISYTYTPAASYTINALSNNESYGTVSLSGSVITATPAAGYTYADPAYTVNPANSATVSQSGDEFTVTPTAETEVTINFEAIPTYTVTLGDDNTQLTETTGGAGVTLPTRGTLNGYDFAGWSETNVSTETTEAPTIIPAGAYAPTNDITLYPIYTKTTGGGGTTHETASVTIADYATANSWANDTQYPSVNLDENITATAMGGGNTGKYYTNGTNWRFYQNESAKVTISTTKGTLTSVTFNFSVNNGGTLNYNSSAITSGTAVNVSGTSAEFTVDNSGTATNGQVRITGISVNYDITGTGTTYYWSSPVAAAVETPSIVVADNPFLFSTTATITCATEGATIKYSYDGENWNDYSDALTITETKTIYAKAVKGEDVSSVAQVTATKNLAEATVTVSGDLTLDLDGGTDVNAGTLSAAVTYNNVAIEGATVTWSGDNDAVATIDASTGAVTIKTTGEVTFTATYAGNSDYTEATGTKTVTVVDSNAPGSENNPYTVAEAIAYINTLGTSTSPNDVYVSGIISQVDEYNSTYRSITYWISDDGTTTGQMEVYSGKGLNGADFSALTDLVVGDVVTVKGKVKNYNSTPEFDKNNQLVSLDRPAIPTIVVTPTSLTDFTYEVGNGPSEAKTFTVEGSNLTENITLSLGESSYEMSLSENSDYTDELSLAPTTGAVAETTVYVRLKAGLDVNTSYEGTITLTSTDAIDKSVSLEGSVTAPEDPNYTWDLRTNSFSAASEDQVTWSGDYATMVVDKAESTTVANNYLGGVNNRTSSRFYTKEELTITPANGYAIASVEFTATTDSYATALKSSTWSNATATVSNTTVTVTPTNGSQAISATIGGTCGITAVKVYYVAPATATIPAGKEWITFCSTANLDFSEAIEGLKGAYTITAHESQAITLTATEMTGTVKAGTGLLLRAAAVDNTNDQVITIPVAATGDEQTDNMLIGVTEDTYIYPTVDEGHKTNLGLSNGAFHPYIEAGTLAAGKAYLQIPTEQMPTGGNNAKLIIVFDGEATGIDNLNVNDNDNIDVNAPIYNLAGQRVNKSYKGVVIVNGKKVVRK